MRYRFVIVAALLTASTLPAEAMQKDATGIWHYTQSESNDRIAFLCARIKDVAAGIAPRNAVGEPWAKGKSFEGRLAVPPGDKDYAGIQAAMTADMTALIAEWNARLAELGKPPVVCGP